MNYQKILNILNETNLFSDEKAHNIFIESLKPQQKIIFERIPKGELNAISALQISGLDFKTKNVSSQIKQLSLNYPIKSKGDKTKYYWK